MLVHPMQLYRTIRASTPAWHLVNLPSRISYLSSRSTLGSHAEDVARDLAATGIAITHVRELFPPEVYRALRSCTDERLAAPAVRTELDRGDRTAEVQSGRKHSFLVDLWGGEHHLDPEHPFHRFSLSQPVLGIVSAYLGMLPKFREFFLQVTVPIPSATAAYSSQRWHADPDDRRMVKVFLYLSDVDETAGPFTYIRYSHGRGKWRNVFPYGPKRHTRHPDPAFIDAHIPSEDRVIAAGPAGTLIFCDTSGIHRGGYATGRPRVMYTSVYTTRASALPTRYPVTSATVDVRSLPRVIRYAIRA